MRTLSVDLSKIPTEKIIKILMKDGTHHLFVDIVVADRDQPDKYGNDVTAWVSQTKEEREQKIKPTYIGNGKKWGTKEIKPKENPFAAQPVEIAKPETDVPF